jgi:pimeloyl-ACP methyl ester carboxylesterase
MEIRRFEGVGFMKHEAGEVSYAVSFREETILDPTREKTGRGEEGEDVNFATLLLSRISGRTLIVHGDCDPLYPVSIALEMHSAIANSRLWIVPNGGHGPIFGELTPPFVATSLAFLNGEWESEGTSPPSG